MTTVDITGQLARYMAQARDLRLAPHVAREAKHRILDTLAAMVSGSHLQAGGMAIAFARAQGGVAEATVLTTDIRTSAVNAALANGMFAHADETDDTLMGPWHPGINVIPAALALGEHLRISGEHFLRAVTLGYDVGTRIQLAAGTTVDFLGPTNSMSGVFGASAGTSNPLPHDRGSAGIAIDSRNCGAGNWLRRSCISMMQLLVSFGSTGISQSMSTPS